MGAPTSSLIDGSRIVTADVFAFTTRAETHAAASTPLAAGRSNPVLPDPSPGTSMDAIGTSVRGRSVQALRGRMPTHHPSGVNPAGPLDRGVSSAGAARGARASRRLFDVDASATQGASPCVAEN